MSRRRASGLIKEEIKVDACYSQLRRGTAICQSQRCDCFGPAVIHCLSKYESEAACRTERAGRRSAVSPIMADREPAPPRSENVLHYCATVQSSWIFVVNLKGLLLVCCSLQAKLPHLLSWTSPSWPHILCVYWIRFKGSLLYAYSGLFF